MRKNILNSILLVVLISVTLACKTKKPVVIIPPNVEPEVINKEKSENIKLLRDKDLSFNTLSLRAKASLDINGNNNNVTMNIRVQKDEKIWVSITAIAGIEVARALITPDSIKIRNNFQSVYLNKPFNYIHRFTNKQVNFQLLQSIFSGNTIGDFWTGEVNLIQDNGVWLLTGQRQDLAYRVLFNTLLKINENNLNDVKTGQALKVVYSNYQKIDNALFPSSIKINSMAGNQKINIDLDFSKIDSNVPLDFPFNVPKKYEVIN